MSNDWVDVEPELEKLQTVVFGNILSEKDFELDKSYITSFEPVKWSEIFEKYEAGFDIRAEKYSHTFGLFSKNIAKRKLSTGTHRMTWCLLLNIQRDQIINHTEFYKMYLKDANDVNKSTVHDVQTQKQIAVDIRRTLSELEIPEFQIPIESGKNPLYNVLIAYSKLQPEIGYC